MEHDSKAGENRERRSCWCEEASGLMRDMMRQMGPPDRARRHFEQAHIEFLRGVRSLIDDRIERMQTRGTAAQGGSTIPVE
jgi:hypothetical protein